MEIKKFGLFFLLGIILVLAFKFYTIISGFIPAMASGCVLAYLFNPVYLYFRKLTKRKSISAFIVIIIVIILILVPVIFIIGALQKQVQFLFSDYGISATKKALQNVDNFFYVKFGIHFAERYFNDIFSTVISTLQDALKAFAPRMIFSLKRFLLSIFMTIFLMYYLLKNSSLVISKFKDYFPLSYKNGDILLKKLGRETKTLILGQFLIAIIQGTLGAIGFLIVGLPQVILWGVVMFITSFIPFLGATLVWIPACIILLGQENYVGSLVLFLWGVLIIGTSDNLIRPKLTSALGTIHPVTVLLGVFIGLKEWGIIGLVIGPMFITVLINLIKMFREEYLT